MGDNGWIPFDEVRPTDVGVQVWAWCVVDQRYKDNVKFAPTIKVLKTYSAPDGTVRINCSAAERVTHWQPYHIPGPPTTANKEVAHGENTNDQA